MSLLKLVELTLIDNGVASKIWLRPEYVIAMSELKIGAPYTQRHVSRLLLNTGGAMSITVNETVDEVKAKIEEVLVRDLFESMVLKPGVGSED